MEPLSLAFVGGSIRSAVGNAHRSAAQLDGLWKLVAGTFSTDSTVNLQTAKAWGVREDRTHDDWRKMLAAEAGNIDAVCVLTPTPAHHEMVAAALDHGIPVVCEKALTDDLDGTRELHHRSNAGPPSFVRCVYNYTGYPMVREIREMIRSGSLGRIRHLDVVMPQEGYLRRDHEGAAILPQMWRRHDPFIPMVSLDLGIHVANLIRFLLDTRMTSVVAKEASFGTVDGVIDEVSAIAETATGAHARLHYGKSSLGNSNGLGVHVYGDDAAVSWVQMDPEHLQVSRSDGTTLRVHRGSNIATTSADARYGRFKAGHPSGFIEAFANHYADIHADLTSWTTERTKSDLTFDTRDALADMEFLHAMSVSARQRRWVDIPVGTS